MMNNTTEELYAFIDEHPELDEDQMIEALKGKFPEQLVDDFVEDIHLLLVEREGDDGRNEE